jgi:hypothetical protein
MLFLSGLLIIIVITVFVQVVCGPIDGFFLYHADNMMATGSEFMIECLRQAMYDLGTFLLTTQLRLV